MKSQASLTVCCWAVSVIFFKIYLDMVQASGSSKILCPQYH
jgi:hypothetical protein